MKHHILQGAGLALRTFIAEHDIQVFSEALAWSADDAPLLINLPIPIPSTRLTSCALSVID
jgi:uncharacterized protein (UPF0276 family)